jgi:uncharacterized protein (TIGR02646 family)
MIQIKRPNAPAHSLQPGNTNDALEAIRKIAKSGKPRSDDFLPLWGREDVRQALWDMQHRKCCYCERVRDSNRESDIEHFRPKALVTGAGLDHKGYWWLAYTWSNLFFSCRHCNQEYKRNHFPIPQEDSRAKLENDDLKKENPLLIDPCEDDPETMLAYDWAAGDGLVWVQTRQQSEKGERTIKLLGLNRDELLRERANLVSFLRDVVMYMHAGQRLGKDEWVQDAADKIRIETASERPFAGFRRDFFRRIELGKYVSRD